MALIIVTFDVPPGDKTEFFKEGRDWIQTVLKMPGLKEFRSYRNVYYASPHVMLHEEFDSMESCLKFIQSKEYYAHVVKMRSLGMTNLSVQMWESTPETPGPLRPSQS